VRGVVVDWFASARRLDEAVEQVIGRALKKASQQIWDRRPIVETVALRL
jgi:ribonuclease J